MHWQAFIDMTDPFKYPFYFLSDKAESLDVIYSADLIKPRRRSSPVLAPTVRTMQGMFAFLLVAPFPSRIKYGGARQETSQLTLQPTFFLLRCFPFCL